MTSETNWIALVPGAQEDDDPARRPYQSREFYRCARLL